MSDERVVLEECDTDRDRDRDKDNCTSTSTSTSTSNTSQLVTVGGGGGGGGGGVGGVTGSGVNKITDKGQNGTNILCQHCPSVILAPNTANFVHMDFSLPYMTQKRGVYTVDREDLTEYWSVDDIYTFENAGFTNTTENVKYLGCADCESGPIGYVNLETKVSYVALTRVRYQ